MGMVFIYGILFILSYGAVTLITGFKYRDKREREMATSRICGYYCGCSVDNINVYCLCRNLYME